MNIKKWEKATNELVVQFIEKYYCDEDIKWEDIEFFWVGDTVGDAMFVNDDYYSLQDVLDCARYSPTEKQFFDFYRANKPMPNLKNWLKQDIQKKREK